MGDDSVSKIVGICIVKVKINGIVRTLMNVRYILKLRRGLISLGVPDTL